MTNVTSLGAHGKMTVDQTLGLVSRENLQDVLIIGYDQDYELVRSSTIY